jgi:hypothetical protein
MSLFSRFRIVSQILRISVSLSIFIFNRPWILKTIFSDFIYQIFEQSSFKTWCYEFDFL